MHKPYAIWKQSTLAALLSAAAGLAHAQAEMFPDPVYATLKLANQVARFPGPQVWNGGPNMLYNAVTPDGKVVLATSPNTASVYAFDGQSGKQLAVMKAGKDAKGIEIRPDGKEAYVANEGDASVSVIDLKEMKAVATIATDKMPHNVRFNADGSRAYVTLQGGAGLGVIDTKARKVIRVIPIPGLEGPHNVDLTSDGSMAWVRDTSNSVAVVDLESGEVKHTMKVGNGHAGIDVSADGRYVFTGAIADDVVSVIDPASYKVVKTIKVGNGPHGVRTSDDGRWLYVAVTADDKVVVVDTKTLEVAKEYPVGSFPFWFAVDGNP